MGVETKKDTFKKDLCCNCDWCDQLEVYARYEIKDSNAFKSTKDTYVG